VEKPKKIGEIDPKPAIQTARVEPPIHERIMSLNHHEAFTLEAIHHEKVRKDLSTFHRIRFITNARQPARSPPPNIVVLNDRYGLAPVLGCTPSNRSRTPPWTINTDRVRTAPMPNHQEKDLTAVLVQGSQPT
jgi:hypothetical protein